MKIQRTVEVDIEELVLEMGVLTKAQFIKFIMEHTHDDKFWQLIDYIGPDAWNEYLARLCQLTGFSPHKHTFVLRILEPERWSNLPEKLGEANVNCNVVQRGDDYFVTFTRVASTRARAISDAFRELQRIGIYSMETS